MKNDSLKKYTPYNKLGLALLPKYNISAGRDGKASILSLARIYFKDYDKVKSSTVGEVTETASGDGRSYIGFLLRKVSESRTEKVQSTPLQGDTSHTTFFGQSPVAYGFSGILFNSPNARWRELFSKLYKQVLRGSVASANGEPTQIIYDDKVVTGWITNLTQDLSAGNEVMVPFSFNLLVLRETILTPDSVLSESLDQATLITSGDKYLENILDLITQDGQVATVLTTNDYVRKAAVRLPPRIKAGGGGISGGCRIYPFNAEKYGATVGAKNSQGPTASKSPTRSSCDLVGSVKKHRAAADKARVKMAKARKAGKDKEATKWSTLAAKHEKNITNAQGWVANVDKLHAGKVKEGVKRYQSEMNKAENVVKPTRAEPVLPPKKTTPTSVAKYVSPHGPRYGRRNY